MTELTFGRFIVSWTLRSTSSVFPSSGLDSKGLWLPGLPGLPCLFRSLESTTSSSACSFPGKRTIKVLCVSSLSLKPGWLRTDDGLSLGVPSSGLVLWWWEWPGWWPGLFVPCGLPSAHVSVDTENTAGVCSTSISCSDVGLACGLFCKGLPTPCEYGFIGLVELSEPWDPEKWWRFDFAVVDAVEENPKREVDVNLMVSFPIGSARSNPGLSVVPSCCCWCCW